MKRFPFLLFLLGTILVAGAVLPLGAQTPGPAAGARPAVIVIRHAEDAASWVGNAPSAAAPNAPYPWPSDLWKEQVPNWPQYFYPFTAVDDAGNLADPHDAGFTIRYHGLSGKWFKDGINGTKMNGKEEPFGEDQAKSLADNLDANFAPGKFAAISRVITMDPRENGATPNPFDTLWPYLKKRDVHTSLGQPSGCDLLLVKRNPNNDKWPGLMAMIDQEKLLADDGGSAIICWTGEGMNGDGGVLDKLVTKYRGEKKDYTWINAKAVRCTDIFVFYREPIRDDGTGGAGVVEWYKFDYKKGTFTSVPKENWKW